ncbi:hypothetical protein PMAYCL1PPCAC_21265 [Pristionchus mayeri]|uniref:Laminin G domain-containing protein n=1 Tax=Pristionchus mayeri TaxID=1317129 RepID=A0AAN5CVH8_9BILA|nr:hypothetical protein PMAYCL1PPCAC_21265 [Pristionchus mayeri]
MRERLPLFLLLLSAVTATRHVLPRRSCRDHYLAGHNENGVYPIKLHKTHTASVACRMPFKGAPQAIVTTVIRSALERGVRVTDARTVQWQLDDFTILRDVLERSTSCKQTIHVNRTAREPGQEKAPLPEPGVMLHSILGETTYIKGDQESGSMELYGRAAGVLHIVPDEIDSNLNPYIIASELVCEEFVSKYDECFINGGVQIDTTGSSHAHFRFAFRTDASNQPLLTVHHEGGARTVVELSNDFFLSLGDGAKPLLFGHVSDGKWHTTQVALDGSHISLDGGEKLQLPLNGPVKQVSIRIDGFIMLTDPMDEAEACIDSKRISRDPQPSHTRDFCANSDREDSCECTMLDDHFRLLPSTSCVHKDGTGNEFTLLRDPELLSFLMLTDSLSSSEPLALSLTFKSDSDSGLLLFGEWRDSTWGRVQVHYHGDKLTASHCTQQDENSIEICRGCSIDRTNGYGTDTWTRVTTFADHNGQLFLTVDSEICQLGAKEEYDTAEMYKTLLTRGSVLFVGGMFNKKVDGIYRDDFKAKFFENTREKLPSLRGCVKDVFARGSRVDVHKAFDDQFATTLINPSEKLYAATMGCNNCSFQCPIGSRCRRTVNSLKPNEGYDQPMMKCDCADLEMYEDRGSCVKQSAAPISLDRNSLTAYRGVFGVRRKEDVLSKIWIKLKLPSHPVENITPLIHFFSHGNIVLFRIFITPEGLLVVQVHPHHGEDYETMEPRAASKFIDPSDDRIHLITIEKKTPLGTHPSRRFYDVYIDGKRFSITDPSMTLTTIEFNLVASPEGQAGCVSDLGLSFDFDEHRAVDKNNTIETVNVLRQMTYEMGTVPSHENTCGVLDPLLWTRGVSASLGPLGHVIDHKPDVYEKQAGGPLSPSWLLYSIILTIILALLLLLCIVIYLCCLRKKTRKNSFDDREQMLRDSPDVPVTYRSAYGPSYEPIEAFYPNLPNIQCNPNPIQSNSSSESSSDDTSMISDSIDRTNFSDYDEPKLHKVKVDRESMISFVEPSADRPVQEAHIIVRSPTPNYQNNAPIVRDDQSDL